MRADFDCDCDCDCIDVADPTDPTVKRPTRMVDDGAVGNGFVSSEGLKKLVMAGCVSFASKVWLPSLFGEAGVFLFLGGM